MKYLREMRFFLPFVEQYPYRRQFFLFVFRELARKDRAPEEFVSLYSYVRATNHLCDRYTTFRSLKRRHDEWLREQIRQQAVDEIGDNQPFPEPWLQHTRIDDELRMVYLRDPEALWFHSREQANCSFSYGSDIRFGQVQLYRLEDSNGRGLATVELVDDGNGNFVLGERLGPRNSALDQPKELAIRSWFRHTNRRDADGAKQREPGQGTRACVLEI